MCQQISSNFLKMELPINIPLEICMTILLCANYWLMLNEIVSVT